MVLPYESRILQEIVIPPGQELTSELPRPDQRRQAGTPARSSMAPWWTLRLTRFPRGGVAAAGRVIEVLGRPGEFGVDVEILIRKHHLPHRFPEEVLDRGPQPRRIPVGDAETRGPPRFPRFAHRHDRRRDGARFR